MKEGAEPDANEYCELLQEYLPRPIRSRSEQDGAEAIVTALLLKPQRSAAEDQILELFSQLIEIWEERHEPVPDVHGVELVRLLLAERRQQSRAVYRVFGTVADASRVLAGRRQLEPDDCIALGKFFGLPPAAFLPA